jgi:hypothetical protein
VPPTFVAVAVLIVAVLPGAAYTFAFEREAGNFGVTAGDRVLRFVASSTVFHLLFTPVDYGIYRLLTGQTGELGIVAFALVYLAVLASVALPAVTGTVLAGLYATRDSRENWTWVRRRLSAEHESRLLRALLGRDPAPRAWDNLFSARPTFYGMATSVTRSAALTTCRPTGSLAGDPPGAVGAPHGHRAQSAAPPRGEAGRVQRGEAAVRDGAAGLRPVSAGASQAVAAGEARAGPSSCVEPPPRSPSSAGGRALAGRCGSMHVDLSAVPARPGRSPVE